jgi:hypothetical protein
VAAVQYTFTHKQYTQYRERNIHINTPQEKRPECEREGHIAIGLVGTGGEQEKLNLCKKVYNG